METIKKLTEINETFSREKAQEAQEGEKGLVWWIGQVQWMENRRRRPAVEHGKQREFVVVLKDLKGRQWVATAWYLNRFELAPADFYEPLGDEWDEENQVMRWTGWHTYGGSPDEEVAYKVQDEVTWWCELPEMPRPAKEGLPT